MNNKHKISIIIVVIFLSVTLFTTTVSATENNNTDVTENQIISEDNTQSISDNNPTYNPDYSEKDNSQTNTDNGTDITNDERKNSEIIIDALNDSQYNDDITVTGKYVDEENNSVRYATLKINVFNITYRVKTDKYGKYSYTFKAKQVGQNTLTVSYSGNVKIIGTEKNATFNVAKKNTNIIINPIDNVQYLDTVNLTGKYVDIDNNNVTYATLKINAYGTTYRVRTDKYGNYACSFKAKEVGESTITITYTGNIKYIGTQTNTTINVTKKNTNIKINPIDNVQYLDTVNLTGKYVDIDNNNVSYATLKINVYNETYRVKTDKYGKYSCSFKAKEVGKATITITYTGNIKYIGTQKNITINVAKKNTKITINPLKNVEYTDKIVVKGKYADVDGRNLKNTRLKIVYHNEEYSIKTNKVGEYTFNINSSKIGKNNISVSYPGNSKYSAAESKLVFTVVAKATNISLDTIKVKNYSNIITISGNYTYNQVNVLRYTPLTVIVDGKNYTVTTDINGKFAFNYTKTRVGYHNLSVSFEGNPRFKKATVNTTFHVHLMIIQSSNKKFNVKYDTGNESVLNNNFATNDKPDISKLGSDYRYADENGIYTITSDEIHRVMKLDSYCQQVYGYTPKYTFFRAEGSNIKYVISRQKWNVIARALNGYHVLQGFSSVNSPYALMIDLTNTSRNYPIFYDSQEYINGYRYTCGPTSMSMISQGLNCYSSEKKLADVYSTTAKSGTSESVIISRSPSVHMLLTNIANTKDAVKNALISGNMIYWHIKGHYMCIVGYNSVTDKFLCLNPSGPSHYIGKAQWATWSQVMNTDKGLKEKGFMKVSAYWSLSDSDKIITSNYYYNMGGKFSVPPNSENPNM